MANVKSAQLKAEAETIASEAALNVMKARAKVELENQKLLNELEVQRAKQLGDIEVSHSFKPSSVSVTFSCFSLFSTSPPLDSST